MHHSTTIAVDLAKSVFEVAVSDRPGRVVERHRLSRTAFLKFLAERQPATVLLEACGSAHHWGRVAKDLGHRPVLLPPHVVRPYVLRNKTDRSDTKGLLEAHRNEDLSPVPVKSVAQQAITALHRTRSAWLATRTARINLVRGVLREFGVTIPVGARNVVPKVISLMQDPSGMLPALALPVLESVCAEIRELEKHIRSVELQLRQLVRNLPAAQRLMTVPGIGLLTSTALVAFVGDVGRFRSGRRFASYLGLTPRERSSGFVRRLGAISKRGDAYLRTLLTHGARAVLRAAVVSAANGKPLDRLRTWAVGIQRLRGHNKATIALANKLARIAWAVWRRDEPFKEAPIH
jgi:transposase